MTGLREAVCRMSGYAPGEQINRPDVIKLNTNENPYPPSPRVFDAIREALTGDKLRKYPPPLGDDFRAATGRILGVDPECILIGNGSDDILTILTRAFVPEGGLIASPTPSYSLYKTLSELQSTRFKTVRFQNDWLLPQPWPLREANITFLANPNSPSGSSLTAKDVEILASQLNGPLVLDEAYGDFAEWNGLSLLKRLPNLIVTRSFSKFYALAGIRFGIAIADSDTIRELVKVKDSYNCDVLSLAAAAAAIQDQEYYAGLRSKILATRSRLQRELVSLGFTVTPSQANFLWCRRSDRPVKPIYEALKQRDILIRYMAYDGYGDGLRISVGTDVEIDRLLAELKAIL
jgi:histidinol-phosphate aminotransferase